MSGSPPLTRSAGILLHPTSLPGPGIGDLGTGARRFGDLLGEMDLRWWQMLPINPTGHGNSPYQSPSAFAGNPMLVSPEELVSAGLLDHQEISGEFVENAVDFEVVIPWKRGLLARATDRFASQPAPATYEAFVDEHGATWLDEFALFSALRRAQSLRPWWEWDADLREREPAALRRARDRLSESIEAIRIEQYLFDRGFRALRAHCRALGIRLIGDLPIFVAHDSVDVWAHPELYLLDDAMRPTVVAGVPPDYFSATGQRWGNPLYDWSNHIATGFEWWTARLRRAMDLFDMVRIDHFRGFVAAWHIPATDRTAVGGTWVPAPGRELLRHLRAEFGELPLIAEDLGVITPEVEALRDDFGLPGMKVLQFGFEPGSTHALDALTPDVVAYTGTHDNNTSRGWFEDTAGETERRAAQRMLSSDGSDFAGDLIEGLFASAASLAIVPLQDVLSLGSAARMNIPGVETGNWKWRFRWEQVSDDVVDRMSELVRRTGRG